MEESQSLDVVERHCVLNWCNSKRSWSNVLKRYVSPEGKLFFRFPMDPDTRSRWINAVAKCVPEDVLHKLYTEKAADCFICRDHFGLKRWMLNYYEYKCSGRNPEKIILSPHCIPTIKLRKCPLTIRVSEFSHNFMEHDYSLLIYRDKLTTHRNRRNKSLKILSLNKQEPFSPSDTNLGHFSNKIAVKTEPEYSTDDIDSFECGEYYFSSNSFKKVSDIPFSDTSETQSMDLEIIPCSFCTQEFCYKSDLLKHVQAEHLDIGPEEFQCNHCTLSFANEQDYLEHFHIYHSPVATCIGNHVDTIVKTETLEEVKLEHEDITNLLEMETNVFQHGCYEQKSFLNNFLIMSTEESEKNVNAFYQSLNAVENQYAHEEIVTQSSEKLESINSVQALDGDLKTLSQSTNAGRNNLKFYSLPSDYNIDEEKSWQNIVKCETLTTAPEEAINNITSSQSINPEENYLKILPKPSQNTNKEITAEKSAFKKKVRRRKRAVINQQTVKNCFIPTCNNSSENSPEKIFFSVPRKCRRWYRVANMEFPKEHRTVSYCCQDHFDLDKDAIYKENLPVLKRNVLPHKLNMFYDIFVKERKRKRTPTSKKSPNSLSKNAQKKISYDTIDRFNPESLLRTYSRKELTGQVKNTDSLNIKIEKIESKQTIDGIKTEIKEEDGINKGSERKNKNKETKNMKTRIKSEGQTMMKELVVKLEVLDPKLYTSKNPCPAKEKISLPTKEKDLKTIKQEPKTNEGKKHIAKAFDLQMFEKHEKHFIKLLDGMSRMRKKEEAKRVSESEKEKSFAKETKDNKIERRHSETTKTEYDDVKFEKTFRKSFDLQEFERHEENYENILNHTEDDDVFDNNVLLKPFKVIKEEIIDDQTTLCLECPNLIPVGYILCKTCKEQQLKNAILIDSQDDKPNSIKEESDNDYKLEIKDEFDKIKFEEDSNTTLKYSKNTSGEESNEQNDKNSKELRNSKQKTKRKTSIDTTKRKCEHCKKEFKHYKNWFEHVKAIHSDKIFTCNICHETFRCKRYLSKHVKKYHSIHAADDQCFICSVCGVTCKTNDSLGQHVKNCHSSSVQCNICHSILKSENYLKSHLRRMHRAEIRKECESCGRDFRNQRQLFIHVRYNHRETMKKCAYCPKRFNTTKFLERHMKSCMRIPPPLVNFDFEIKVEPADSDEDWCIKE